MVRSTVVCSLLLWAALSGGSQPVRAEPLTVGCLRYSKDLNWLAGEGPAAWLVRRAAAAGLTRPHRGRDQNDPSFRLDLARSLRSSGAGREWQFDLRAGLLFSNGQPVSVEDVKYSLERCRATGRLDPQVRFSVESMPDQGVGEAVRVRVRRADEQVAPLLPQVLAECPVLEAYSSRLFGTDLGLGTNLVAAGSYEIAGSHAGRQTVLRRSRAAGQRGGGPEEVVIRGFESEEAALTALRVGTVGAFIDASPEILAKAAGDETLAVEQCGSYPLVRRRSLEPFCGSDLDLSAVSLEN